KRRRDPTDRRGVRRNALCRVRSRALIDDQGRARGNDSDRIEARGTVPAPLGSEGLQAGLKARTTWRRPLDPGAVIVDPRQKPHGFGAVAIAAQRELGLLGAYPFRG